MLKEQWEIGQIKEYWSTSGGCCFCLIPNVPCRLTMDGSTHDALRSKIAHDWSYHERTGKTRKTNRRA